MSGLATEQHRVLQKIKVLCKTCGVSESYYSNLSVEKFKAKHSGHEVTDGSERAAAVAAPPVAPSGHEVTDGSERAAAVAAPPVAHEEKAAPEEGRPLARRAGTSVAKVMVDMLDFPSLDSSIVRVRGFDTDLEEVFTATMSSSESPKVGQMVAAGEYLDREASGLLYFWEPDVVEYVGDVKDKLGLMAESEAKKKVATTAQPGPDPSESEEVIDQATVASAAEVLVDALGGDETVQTGDEEVSVPPSPPSDPSEYLEEVAPTLPQQPTQELPPEPELMEAARVPSPPARAQHRVKRMVEKPSKITVAPAREASDDEYLLVSKSWYIQGGQGNRKDAVRVSKVLKAFRWKVEPIYTIGVILDDMLSIETSRGQISGTLIKRVESAGYRLTAVTIDQGKPVAWFKREGSATPSLQVDSISGGLDDSDIELEPDVTG